MALALRNLKEHSFSSNKPWSESNDQKEVKKSSLSDVTALANSDGGDLASRHALQKRGRNRIEVGLANFVADDPWPKNLGQKRATAPWRNQFKFPMDLSPTDARLS